MQGRVSLPEMGVHDERVENCGTTARLAKVTAMAASIDQRLVSRPELCDIVDAEWARDTLPDDGVHGPMANHHCPAGCHCVMRKHCACCVCLLLAVRLYS